MTGSLASVHPELIPEWSEKNLPLTPDKITFGSNKRVWWKGACGHEWETSVKARSKGEKCPICSGARVIEGINDLATLKPLLAQEWSEKNELKPTEVSVASHKKIIWKCKHGHEWEASVKSRTVNGTGCPYCSHNKVLTGFDAPRLKRLYFGRKLKDHNLLQAITRVNRPYKENHYGYVIDFANIKRNFEETNEAYLKELNRFNDPNEVGAGNETDTFKQVIEDPAELIKQMQEVQQVLFNYTTDNAEEFSSEISTIEDKQELLKLKKILIAARDCCNLVRTFGDDELKETFAKMELTKLPSLISEVQHHIDNINQKELFASDDTTKLLVNEAMEDITFNFSKISEEELKIIGGKDAVTEKYKKTVRAFTQNIDPDDPEFITLQEAFLLRFKQHGFEPKSVSEIEEQGKELEDILKKLDELQKKNTVLLRKYNGDAKFARVHKRIREENLARKAANKQPIVSEYDMSIMNVLLSIKSDIDQKVYDRNDILKKDAYFERTVMTQIKAGIDKLGIASAREDRVFIQSRITKQYLDQYNQTYSVA